MTKDTLVHDMLVAANFNHTPYRDGMEAALRVAEDHYCVDVTPAEAEFPNLAPYEKVALNHIFAARRLTQPLDTRRERIEKLVGALSPSGDFKMRVDAIMAIVNEVKP